MTTARLCPSATRVSDAGAAPAPIVRNGTDKIVETLLELGVDTVFGYPGGAVLPLYDALIRDPSCYTDDELAQAYQLYRDEPVRGADKRYWEDVAEGEELPVMFKGPMTVAGFIACAQGWGDPYIRANKLAWKLIDAHPGLGIANRFGIPDCPERVHWEEEFALEVGEPGAYDDGPERSSWLTHHLPNWMGDDGFLRRAHHKIRRHNPAGDLLFIQSKVKRKFVEDGRALVEIEQEARNQDDELSVLGGGIIELPRRG